MPKDNLDDIITLFFGPIYKIILSGTDKMAQISASIVLCDLVEHLGQDEKYLELILKIRNKVVNTIIKSKCDSPQIFETLFHLMKTIKLEKIFHKLPEIYEKFITVLNSQAHFLVIILINYIQLKSIIFRLKYQS